MLGSLCNSLTSAEDLGYLNKINNLRERGNEITNKHQSYRQTKNFK